MADPTQRLRGKHREQLRTAFVKRFVKEHMSVEDIAQLVSMPPSVVRALLDEAGVKHPVSEEKSTRDLVERYNQGASLAALARETGLDTPVVKGILVDAGATLRVPTRHFVPSEHVKQIVTRYRSGESIRSVTDSTPYSYNVVRRTLLNAGVKLRPVGGAPKGGHVRDIVRTQEAATAMPLSANCTVNVTVDPAKASQVTLRVDRPGDEPLFLVLPEPAVYEFTKALAVAKDKMERARCLNWTHDDLCPDELWDFVRTFIPAEPTHTGRRRRTREAFAAVMYVLVNHCRWRDLPKRFDVGYPMARRRFREWHAIGLWSEVYTGTYMYGDTGLSTWSINLCQKAHYAARGRMEFEEKMKHAQVGGVGEHAWAAMFSPMDGRHALMRIGEPT